MKKFILILVIGVLQFSQVVFSQVVIDSEIDKPLPHHELIRNQKKQSQQEAANLTLKQVEFLAEKIKAQFNAHQQVVKTISSENMCKKGQIEQNALAFLVLGKYSACYQMVETCLANQESLSSQALSLAAQCYTQDFNYHQAHKFYELASQVKDENLNESLFQWAAFSLTNYQTKPIQDIFKLMTNHEDQNGESWYLVLKRLNKIDLKSTSAKTVDDFIALKINEFQKLNLTTFVEVLKNIQFSILLNDYNYSKGLEFLYQEAPQFKNPMNWVDTGYSMLFYGLDQNFAWARILYDSVKEFDHLGMRFPNENNTYNYSQLYSQVCKNNLMQGWEKLQLKDIQEKLRTGVYSVDQALEKALQFNNLHPNKADVLTLLGSLNSLKQEHDISIQYYFKAHQLCRYYNRAHWGLTIAKRYKKYQLLPDFKDNELNFKTELSNITVPHIVSDYFINWKSLPQSVQERVVFGARIWLPYLNVLLNSQKKTYIKYVHDLLSESPDWESVKDSRIGGTQYPNDNRLWDDVRGIGGAPVVADLHEVFQTIQGDYNLLGHEMAHQVHQYFKEKVDVPALCIEKQYLDSKKKNNFPDAYSSYNKEEHFAQGVTYYLVSPLAAARFGLNQTWVKENNTQQFNFIASIEKAQGEVKKIKCE